jgi:hypothetical protein
MLQPWLTPGLFVFISFIYLPKNYNMSENSQFLLRFTRPIVRILSSSPTGLTPIANRANEFIQANESLTHSDFIAKAEAEFGAEVRYYERFCQYKDLRGIYNMVKFFVIFTAVTAALGLLAVLSTIK